MFVIQAAKNAKKVGMEWKSLNAVQKELAAKSSSKESMGQGSTLLSGDLGPNLNFGADLIESLRDASTETMLSTSSKLHVLHTLLHRLRGNQAGAVVPPKPSSRSAAAADATTRESTPAKRSRIKTNFYKPALSSPSLSSSSSSSSSSTQQETRQNPSETDIDSSGSCSPLPVGRSSCPAVSSRASPSSPSSRRLPAADPSLTRRFPHRVVIFSQFTSMLDVLESYCQSQQFTYKRLDGSTNLIIRELDVREFNGPGADFFIYLISTRAGGMGINLQVSRCQSMYACHHVGNRFLNRRCLFFLALSIT